MANAGVPYVLALLNQNKCRRKLTRGTDSSISRQRKASPSLSYFRLIAHQFTFVGVIGQKHLKAIGLLSSNG